MSNSTLLLYSRTGFKTRAARKFDKEVLRVGRWIHPANGAEVLVDQLRLDVLGSWTNRYMKTSDGKIPFQDGHNFGALKTLGWWTEFRVEGDRLIGTVEVTDDQAVRMIDAGSLMGVSVGIYTGWKDTRGREYPEVILHVAATPVPVVDGLADFIALSQDASGGNLYQFQPSLAQRVLDRVTGAGGENYQFEPSLAERLLARVPAPEPEEDLE